MEAELISLRWGGEFSNKIPQILPLQQLHDDKGMTIVLLHLIDRADVGVVQRGGGAGLSLKSL